MVAFNSALSYLYSDDVMHRISLLIYNVCRCCGHTNANEVFPNDVADCAITLEWIIQALSKP